jgi:predicted nucleic acid-binding protein
MRKKFAAHKIYLTELLDLVSEVSVLIKPRSQNKFLLTDLGDQKYLDLALEVQADLLITGNLKDFPNRQYDNLKVISARDAISLFVS